NSRDRRNGLGTAHSDPGRGATDSYSLHLDRKPGNHVNIQADFFHGRAVKSLNLPGESHHGRLSFQLDVPCPHLQEQLRPFPPAKNGISGNRTSHQVPELIPGRHILSSKIVLTGNIGIELHTGELLPPDQRSQSKTACTAIKPTEDSRKLRRSYACRVAM